MAGASDKARFYLEQSIPELQELEQKKILTKDEITSVAKKRSDFEHKLNARGSRPADYVRYVEYEMNFDTLRRKRAKRLGVKTSTHGGQRRIIFILERATRKFHGDLGLWIQYLDFAKRQKAWKKVTQILTSVLRLHPTRPELWIYAASHAMESQGDMTGARSYMQRGLRFCKKSRELWVEYGKLEMMYIARIARRQRILGIDENHQKPHLIPEMDTSDADHISLPTITAEDLDPSLRIDDKVDEDAVQKLNATPALSGAIPIAIFDAAMENFHDPQLGERFFVLFAEQSDVPCLHKVLRHTVEALISLEPGNPSSLNCFIRQPLIGIDANSLEFPSALGSSLSRLKSSMESKASSDLISKSVDWLVHYLKGPNLDPDIRTVLVATLNKSMSQYRTLIDNHGSGSGDQCANILETLQTGGTHKLLKALIPWSLKTWPSNTRLAAIQDGVLHKNSSIIRGT